MTEIETKINIAPPKFIRTLIGSFENIKTVLELGNKTNKKGVPYRSWYIKQGCEYTCIDWNGKDNCLSLDLTEAIDIGTFDLVTNIGTTEHVEDQESCWRNIHNAIKVGGIFASHTPHKGMITHGYWHPTIQWCEEFAELNGYNILYTCVDIRCNNVRFQKIKDLEFTFPTTEMYRTEVKFLENRYKD